MLKGVPDWTRTNASPSVGYGPSYAPGGGPVKAYMTLAAERSARALTQAFRDRVAQPGLRPQTRVTGLMLPWGCQMTPPPLTNRGEPTP